MKKIYITLLTLCVAAVAYSQRQNEQFTPDQKLRAAEAIIENFYVEDVNSDTIVNEAIVAMLKTLDPHSAYSTPQKARQPRCDENPARTKRHYRTTTGKTRQ